MKMSKYGRLPTVFQLSITSYILLTVAAAATAAVTAIAAVAIADIHVVTSAFGKRTRAGRVQRVQPGSGEVPGEGGAW